jgi:hypothetical protein
LQQRQARLFLTTRASPVRGSFKRLALNSQRVGILNESSSDELGDLLCSADLLPYLYHEVLTRLGSTDASSKPHYFKRTNLILNISLHTHIVRKLSQTSPGQARQDF